MAGMPRVTFGIIVLNGEPFTRYNVRALYPLAHEIIVVEGASGYAAHAATPDGHSVDGTLETLRQLKAEEDPQNKILIVTAEDEGHPDGFWPGEKNEQSQAYAKRATGEWLWQVDIDEFYQPEDMTHVLSYLQAHPEVTCLTFQMYHFWGGFDYCVDGGLIMSHRFLGEPWGAVRRIFRWQCGYRYDNHRPPTIVDSQGANVTTQVKRNITRLLGSHVRTYHYFMVYPHQILRKGRYYANLGGEQSFTIQDRMERLFTHLRPEDRLEIFTHFGTRNWLWRFDSAPPPVISQMRANVLAEGRFALRQTADIEAIFAMRSYHFETCFWKVLMLLKTAGDLAVRAARLVVRHTLPAQLRIALRAGCSAPDSVGRG